MSRKALFLVSAAAVSPDILYLRIVRAATVSPSGRSCTCFGIKAAYRGFSWESCSPHSGYQGNLLASFFKASLSVRQVDEVWKFLILNKEGGSPRCQSSLISGKVFWILCKDSFVEKSWDRLHLSFSESQGVRAFPMTNKLWKWLPLDLGHMGRFIKRKYLIFSNFWESWRIWLKIKVLDLWDFWRYRCAPTILTSETSACHPDLLD